MDEWFLAATFTVLALGALWWVYIRDDGGWGSGDDVKLAPIDYKLGSRANQPVLLLLKISSRRVSSSSMTFRLLERVRRKIKAFP